MPLIIRRAVVLGTVVGAFAGTCVATAFAGIFGVLFGAAFGAAAGAALGVVNGLALVRLARRSGSARRSARIVPALVSGGCAVAAEAGFWHGRLPFVALAVTVPIVCAVCGALCGPIALYGPRPVSIGRAGRGLQDALSRLLVAFLLLGGGAGAVVGLVIGLDTYPPTAWAAAVEGAAIGVAAVIPLFAVAAIAWLGPRVRARW